MDPNNKNETTNQDDESSPLLSEQTKVGEEAANDQIKSIKNVEKVIAKPEKVMEPIRSPVAGWPAHGMPLSHGDSVMGQTMVRVPWDSSIIACLGRHDEFCSSDLEVCLLGSVAPCMLYGSNVERLGSTPGTFANHCLPYTGLYFIGNSLFGWNCLAPWFSYPSRSAIRRRFNLEGSCETLHRTYGCGGSCIEDEVQREQCETSFDLAAHIFCHPCALCQEGRELRRRLPHPGFHAQPVLVMIPPSEQSMGRGA
jgi:Cys-rich protein (TIGR01571 family)